MQGIIIVDKPTGFTSFDVIAKLRGILKTKKIGHSGTLDPMATGVLPVFVGRAAKAVDMQENHDKAYVASIKFGIATDTADITGTVIKECDANVSQDDFTNALSQIVGSYGQIPPMYSAVKINGVPLYKSARKGKIIEREPRPVTIYNADFLSQKGENEFEFYVKCSKGTYIRVICEELGAKLGVPAVMTALRRTQAGVYNEADAHSLQEIQAAKNADIVESLFLPTESVFLHLPVLNLSDNQMHLLLNGAVCDCNADIGRFRLLYKDNFVGVASAENAVLTQIKLFCEREELA